MSRSNSDGGGRLGAVDALGDSSLGPLLAKQGALSIVGDMLGRGLKYITLIVMARLMDTDLLGGFLVATALMDVLVLVAGLGFTAGIVRFGTRFLQEGRKAQLRALFRWSIARSGTLGLVISIAVFAVSLMVFKTHRGESVFLFLRAIIWCLPIMVAATAMTFVTVAMKTVIYQKLAMVIQPGLLLVISLTAFLFESAESRMVMVAVAYVASWIVTLAFMIVVLRVLGVVGRVRGSTQQVDAKRMWTFSLPTLGSSLVNMLRQQADILLITLFLSTREVALYNVASRTAGILTLALLGFSSIFDPLVVDYRGRRETRSVTRTNSLVTRWALSFCLPVALIIFVYPGEMLAVFGAEFLEASTIVRVLVLGRVLNVATGLVGRVLLMTDHQHLELYNGIGFLIANLGLNLVLIPRFGPLGAALTAALSLTMLNAVRLFQVWRVVGVVTDWSAVLKPLLAVLMVGMCIGMVYGHIVMNSVLSAGVFLLMSFLLYSVALLALGLEPEERRLLLSLLYVLQRQRRGGNGV
jgi:O-antigen/teichoic acid export membrane protein